MCVRLLRLIVARQTDKTRTIRNDRLLAVPVTPNNKPKQRGVRDLAAERLTALEQFFILYNRAQGRTFKPESRRARGPLIELWLLASTSTQTHQTEFAGPFIGS